MTLGQTGRAIRDKLNAAFMPSELEVIDESRRHAGHGGARAEGESHFRVRVVSDRFNGISRVGRHRMVNAALAAEIAAGVHALAIEAKAPGEG